jgi:hypothetical protein
MTKIALAAFSSVLSLATTSYTCSPCTNADAIIDPAFEIQPLGLTDPIPISSCETLVSTLLFIPEESDLSTDAKALGSCCGCAVETNSWQVCGEEGFLEEPGRVLDAALLESAGCRTTKSYLVSASLIFSVRWASHWPLSQCQKSLAYTVPREIKLHVRLGDS